MNTVIISGNIGKEPEVRFTKSGKAVAKFTVFFYNGKKPDGGFEQDGHVDCLAWERTAEAAGELEKGATITVSGKLKTDHWTDQQGNNRSKTYVQAFEIKENVKHTTTTTTNSGFDAMGQIANDEEIPF